MITYQDFGSGFCEISTICTAVSRSFVHGWNIRCRRLGPIGRMEQWRISSILGCCPCRRRGWFCTWRGVWGPAGVRWDREVGARVGVFPPIVVLIAARDVDGVG
eukprot:472629-Pleurochrysis_carterae.AAC.1